MNSYRTRRLPTWRWNNASAKTPRSSSRKWKHDSVRHSGNRAWWDDDRQLIVEPGLDDQLSLCWLSACLTIFHLVDRNVILNFILFGISLINLLNIWEFVYFVWSLSPPKRHVVRRWNFALRYVPTMCRTCAGFYVYRGRCYENNDIFPKIHAYRVTLWLQWPLVGWCNHRQ